MTISTLTKHLPERISHKSEHKMTIDEWIDYFSNNQNNGFIRSDIKSKIYSFSIGGYSRIHSASNWAGAEDKYDHDYSVMLYSKWVSAILKGWPTIKNLGLRKSRPSGLTRSNPAVIIAKGVNTRGWNDYRYPPPRQKKMIEEGFRLWSGIPDENSQIKERVRETILSSFGDVVSKEFYQMLSPSFK